MNGEGGVSRPATTYRADIDGLRAVSIILVVLFHAQPWLMPGGFVGVDVFFVISGFLITRIVLVEAGQGSFSLASFYARRIRRIFPALFVVLAAVYLVGWIVLLPDAFSLLGQNIAAGVGFVSNLFQLRQTGYFAPDAGDNPLLHLWSLGVEEQFYIVWPLLLLAIAASPRRRIWMIVIAAASFAVGLLIFFGYREWSFYSPLPRAWELLAGAMLAERAIRGTVSPRSPRVENIQATIGILAIAGAAFFLDRDSLFPGLYALLPVLGAVLIILSPNSFVNRSWLSSRPAVFLGRISYPLYLWHWPLLVYLQIVRNGVPNVAEIWAAVLVAVILAWLTWRLVELPIRHKRYAVPMLSFGLAGLGIIGIATYAASGFDFRFPPEIREIARLSPKQNAGFREACFLQTGDGRFSSACIEPGDKPLLFVWGDSTAAALVPGLRAAQTFRLAHFSSAGCAPVLKGTGARCDETAAAALSFLRGAQPDVVLLQAMWDEVPDLEPLRLTIAQIRTVSSARIVILGPVPVWKRTLPTALVNAWRFRRVVADRIRSGVSGPGGDDRMAAFSKSVGVDYISAWRELCDAEGCLTRVGPEASDVVTTDNVHMSDHGSIFLIGRIAARLQARR